MQAQRRKANHDAQHKRGRHRHRDGDEVVGVEGVDHHAGRVRADTGKGRLAQRDLPDVTRKQDEAEDAECPHHGQRRVELEPDVEADGNSRQDAKEDEHDEETEHQLPGHRGDATVSPFGFRRISTARITISAISRGKPSELIQMVG